jgi:hypothetical protein
MGPPNDVWVVEAGKRCRPGLASQASPREPSGRGQLGAISTKGRAVNTA